LWLIFLALYLVLALGAVIIEGSLSEADIEWIRNGVIGTFFVSILVGCGVSLSDPIEHWWKARKERRELETRGALRSRRDRARAAGVPDLSIERPNVLVASLRPEDRLRAREFTVRRTRDELRDKGGCLPIYALLAAVGFVGAWQPLGEFLGVGLSTLLIIGVVLGIGLTISAHAHNAAAQMAPGDPVLLLGTVVGSSESTSAESLGIDEASSSIYGLKIRVRASQGLGKDGSFGPAPARFHGTVQLSSFDTVSDRVRPGEHVAILATPAGRAVGRLEDAFATGHESDEQG
jgi:hypothetical protein